MVKNIKQKRVVIGIENCYKKLNPQINFLLQKYFFDDNPTWNINYLEQVFQVGTWSTKNQQVKILDKNKIDKFGIALFDVKLTKQNRAELELTKWNRVELRKWN